MHKNRREPIDDCAVSPPKKGKVKNKNKRFLIEYRYKHFKKECGWHEWTVWHRYIDERRRDMAFEQALKQEEAYIKRGWTELRKNFDSD